MSHTIDLGDLGVWLTIEADVSGEPGDRSVGEPRWLIDAEFAGATLTVGARSLDLTREQVVALIGDDTLQDTLDHIADHAEAA
jgi:hypothetical protein